MPQLESDIQNAIKHFMEQRGWFVLNMHGNRYQRGVPDLYGCHKYYGARWVECKRKQKWKLTKYQKLVFPQIISRGIGIWFLQSVTDYDKLFLPANYKEFMNAAS